MNSAERNNRILVIDDNAAIHEDMRKILCPELSARSPELDELEAAILGPDSGRTRRPSTPSFQLDYAHQGQEGLALLQRSLQEDRPYAMAFVDMRMPPGWDGLQTTLELWKASPELQVVICTAYSDYSWEELIDRIGDTDRLVILKKPFESVEVLQLANALTTKWTLELRARAQAIELEERVQLRTAELEASNETLKSEIERRMQVEASLVSARDAAEAAARAKSTFLANMSHEVRTPMNGVIGMANLLLHTSLDEEQRELVQTLTQSGESLLAIINDILDFSKVEAGKVELESIEFNLVDELALAIDLTAEAASKKGIELILDVFPTVPSAVTGDPVRVRQVLINLVSNAIKFTTKGEVVVRISVAGEHHGRCKLRFEVSDTGIGIAAASLANLFQPFMQADASMTRRFGGTGLGLAISRRLVELMGGSIGARSHPGAGSTFWFDLDLQVAAAESVGSTPPSAGNSLRGRRVLIVDTNATFRDVVSRQLTAWGMLPATAETVESCRLELERAASRSVFYDAVVMDNSLAMEFEPEICADSIAGDPNRRPVIAILTRSRLGPAGHDNVHPRTGLCESKPINPRKLRSLMERAVLTATLASGPRPACGAAPSNSTAPPAAPGRTARILVADDNVVNQKVAVLQLKKLGYDADVANDGREALAALAARHYDLVFMDAQMPELDGFETTRIIREAQTAGDPTYPAKLPIIAMTAHAMVGVREECLAAGMDDYLPKPVRIDRLCEMLASYLTTGGTVPAVQNA